MVKKGYKQTEAGVIPEDWECVKIKDVATISMCKRIFANQTSTIGDVPFYKIGTFGKEADAYISSKLYVEYRNKYSFPQKGDILISAAGTLGRTVVYDGEKAYFQDSNIVWLDINKTRLCNEYLNQYYKVIKWASSEGSTIARLYNGIIYATYISLPPLPEQQRIAEALSDVDGMISSLEKLIAKYKSIKTACLQQMFPQNGETVPRMRLPGFTGAWEQRKLGEMGQTYTGLSGKTKDDFGHGQARFVTYMNVYSNPISNPEMTEPIEIDPKQNEVEVGDVFFTTSSETPEEVGMSSVLLEKRGKTYLNSFCFGFRPSEKIDSYYLAYMLRSESARAKITLLAQGISRYNISKNKVMEIAVSLPSLDEQKMIGQYFCQLDNLITLHQRKLEKVQKIKQGMMQQLLTGKIRLI